ncbi:MAG: tetratricopeptide repeat protein, partial [Deltaproteobacteria bacterium]|nr:tetratricopeptide repeat protein [Deltaproteobacteria bacterium]
LRRDFEAQFSARLKKIDETVEALNRSAHKTTAEVSSQVDELVVQLQKLQGQLEEQRFRFEELGKRIDELERKLLAMGGAEAVERAERQKSLKELVRPADKQKFFDLARSYHERRDYFFSRALLAEFLAKWPADELAARAQLLLGDSYFDEKQYRPAIFEYQKVREGWPKSKWVPESLLKLGLCFQELGLAKEAKPFFEEAARAPGEVGKDAKAKLKELSPPPVAPAPKSGKSGPKK